MSSLNIQQQVAETFSVYHPFASICVRSLHSHEAHQAWLFHKEARRALPQEEKHFLLPKKLPYFRQFNDESCGVLLGAFAGTKLVGIVAVAKHKHLWDAYKNGAITAPNTKLLARKYKAGPVGIVQAFCTSEQDGIGRGAAGVLLNAVETYMRDEKFAHSFAQTAQDNKRGLACFKKQNYVVVADWVSPLALPNMPVQKDHPRFLLHTPVQRSMQAFWPAAISSKEYSLTP